MFFHHEAPDGERAGLLPRAAMHIFAELPASCEVRVSCTELYNDTLYDLLTRGAPTRLRETAQRESGGARLLIVRTATELIEAVRNAELRRHISQRTRHSLLARSHRGHLFLTIHVGTPAANDAAEAIAAGGIGGSGFILAAQTSQSPAAGSPWSSSRARRSPRRPAPPLLITGRRPWAPPPQAARRYAASSSVEIQLSSLRRDRSTRRCMR